VLSRPLGKIVPALDEVLPTLAIEQALAAVRVIELEDVRLGSGRQCAETVRVQRIALILDRPSIDGRHQQTERRATDFHGRCVPLGHAGSPTIRSAGKGNDLLLRPATRGQSGESDGRPHDFEELTTGGWWQPIPLVIRELASYSLLEFRSLRELVEASPVLLAILRL